MLKQGIASPSSPLNMMSSQVSTKSQKFKQTMLTETSLTQRADMELGIKESALNSEQLDTSENFALNTSSILNKKIVKLELKQKPFIKQHLHHDSSIVKIIEVGEPSLNNTQTNWTFKNDGIQNKQKLFGKHRQQVLQSRYNNDDVQVVYQAPQVKKVKKASISPKIKYPDPKVLSREQLQLQETTINLFEENKISLETVTPECILKSSSPYKPIPIKKIKKASAVQLKLQRQESPLSPNTPPRYEEEKQSQLAIIHIKDQEPNNLSPKQIDFISNQIKKHKIYQNQGIKNINKKQSYSPDQNTSIVPNQAQKTQNTTQNFYNPMVKPQGYAPSAVKKAFKEYRQELWKASPTKQSKTALQDQATQSKITIDESKNELEIMNQSTSTFFNQSQMQTEISKHLDILKGSPEYKNPLDLFKSQGQREVKIKEKLKLSSKKLMLSKYQEEGQQQIEDENIISTLPRQLQTVVSQVEFQSPRDDNDSNEEYVHLNVNQEIKNITNDGIINEVVPPHKNEEIPEQKTSIFANLLALKKAKEHLENAHQLPNVDSQASLGSFNPLTSQLNKLLNENISRASNEKEQIKFITMKELTEMPLDQVRTMYDQKNAHKQHMIKRLFQKMKRFEDKYLDALQGISQGGQDGYTLDFKNSYKLAKVIDFTYNISSDIVLGEEQIQRIQQEFHILPKSLKSLIKQRFGDFHEPISKQKEKLAIVKELTKLKKVTLEPSLPPIQIHQQSQTALPMLGRQQPLLQRSSQSLADKQGFSQTMYKINTNNPFNEFLGSNKKIQPLEMLPNSLKTSPFIQPNLQEKKQSKFHQKQLSPPPPPIPARGNLGDNVEFNKTFFAASNIKSLKKIEHLEEIKQSRNTQNLFHQGNNYFSMKSDKTNTLSQVLERESVKSIFVENIESQQQEYYARAAIQNIKQSPSNIEIKIEQNKIFTSHQSQNLLKTKDSLDNKRAKNFSSQNLYQPNRESQIFLKKQSIAEFIPHQSLIGSNSQQSIAQSSFHKSTSRRIMPPEPNLGDLRLHIPMPQKKEMLSLGELNEFEIIQQQESQRYNRRFMATRLTIDHVVQEYEEFQQHLHEQSPLKIHRE